MPDPIIADQTQTTPPPVFPEVTDIPTMPQESNPIDIPPIITEPKIPKKKSGRIIATILGILLLISAVGAGVVLVGQKQLFQQKAALAEPCKACVGTQCQTVASPPNCTPSFNECSTNSQCGTPICTNGQNRDADCTQVLDGQTCPGKKLEVCLNGNWGGNYPCLDIVDNCPSGGGGTDSCGTGLTCKNYAGGTACLNAGGDITDCTTKGGSTGNCCVPTGVCTEGQNRDADCTQTLNGQQCPGKRLEICKNGRWDDAQYPCLDIVDNCPPPTTCSGTDSCIPDHENTICEQVNGQWQRCTHYVGDNGYKCDLCNGVKASDTKGQCAVANHYCIPGGYCITNTTCEYRATSCTPDPSCATSTPTATLGINAMCSSVKAYGANWNLLTGAQLSALTAGSIVRFTVSGIPAGQINKARFTINGVLGPEVINKKPGTDEYYVEYTIPPVVTSFTVTAQIHHVTLDWF